MVTDIIGIEDMGDEFSSFTFLSFFSRDIDSIDYRIRSISRKTQGCEARRCTDLKDCSLPDITS